MLFGAASRALRREDAGYPACGMGCHVYRVVPCGRVFRAGVFYSGNGNMILLAMFLFVMSTECGSAYTLIAFMDVVGLGSLTDG